MSNTKVYGYCDAGCRYRVPTYDEFEKFAAFIEQFPDVNGYYKLEYGKKYKVFVSSKLADGQYFGVNAVVFGKNGISELDGMFPTRISGDPYFTIMPISYLASGDGCTIRYLYNEEGREYTDEYSNVGSTADFLIYGADEVYLINDDAEIRGLEGKSAYEIACDKGFEGTEEAWLESLKVGSSQDADIFLTNGSYGLSYELSETHAMCSGIGICTESDIEIASKVRGLPVYGIKDGAFAYCKSIKSVTIPDSVVTIGESAFECTNLTSVNIGNGVLSIGTLAFFGCGMLESVTIGNFVTTIGEKAFGSCSSLLSITIPAGVKTIGQNAFTACGLKEIKVSTDNVYYRDIDGNLYTRDYETLIQYATGKDDTHFTVPYAVKTISRAAFAQCTKLISVNIPTNVTSIGDSVFYGCTNLTSVTIGSGVTSISNSAFVSCTNLTSVIICKQVTQIEDNAFFGCSQLTDVYYMGTEATWNAISVGTYNDALAEATIYFYSETQPTTEGNYWHYVDDVITVWKVVEFESEGLAYTISDDKTYYSVTGIGDLAEAEAIEIPSTYCGLSVTHILPNAFSNNTFLKSVVIPDSVTHIMSYAFRDCPNLESVTIGVGAIVIGTVAFCSCGLKSIIVDENNPKYKSDEHNCFLLTKDGKTLVRYAIEEESTRITPDGVEEYGDSAFANCNRITDTIPVGVTKLGAYCYENSTELEILFLPDTIKLIGTNAFSGCTKLERVAYFGTDDDWDDVEILEGNDCLTNAQLFIMGTNGGT